MSLAEMKPASALAVGDRVIVPSTGQKGTLRFWGTTDFKEGLWAGVELDDNTGKNDGSIQGISYFQCPPQRGLFVLAHRITRDTTTHPIPTPSGTYVAATASPAKRKPNTASETPRQQHKPSPPPVRPATAAPPTPTPIQTAASISNSPSTDRAVRSKSASASSTGVTPVESRSIRNALELLENTGRAASASPSVSRSKPAAAAETAFAPVVDPRIIEALKQPSASAERRVSTTNSSTVPIRQAVANMRAKSPDFGVALEHFKLVEGPNSQESLLSKSNHKLPTRSTTPQQPMFAAPLISVDQGESNDEAQDESNENIGSLPSYRRPSLAMARLRNTLASPQRSNASSMSNSFTTASSNQDFDTSLSAQAESSLLRLQLGDSQAQVQRLRDDLTHAQSQFRSELLTLRDQNTALTSELGRMKNVIQDQETVIREQESEMDRWVKEAESMKRSRAELESEHQMRLDEIDKQITTLDLERSEELERARESFETEKAKMFEDFERKLDREREKFEKLAAEKDRWRQDVEGAREKWLQKEAELEQRQLSLDKKLLEAYSTVEALRKEKEGWKKERAAVADKIRQHQDDVNRALKKETERYQGEVEARKSDQAMFQAERDELNCRIESLVKEKSALLEQLNESTAITEQVRHDSALKADDIQKTWQQERSVLVEQLSSLNNRCNALQNQLSHGKASQDAVEQQLAQEKQKFFLRLHEVDSEKSQLSERLNEAQSKIQTLEQNVFDQTNEARNMSLQIQTLIARVKETEKTNKTLQTELEGSRQTASAQSDEVELIQKERKDLLQRLQNADAERKTLAEQVKLAKQNVQSIELDLSQRDKEIRQLTAEKDDLLKRVGDSQSLVSTLKASESLLRDDIAAQKSAFTIATKQVEDLHKRAADLESHVETLKTENQAIPALRSRVQELEQRIDRSNEEVVSLKEYLSKAKTQEAHLKDELVIASQTLESERNTFNLQLGEADYKLRELQSTEASLRENFKTQAAELESLNKAMAELYSNYASLSMDTAREQQRLVAEIQSKTEGLSQLEQQKSHLENALKNLEDQSRRTESEMSTTMSQLHQQLESLGHELSQAKSAIQSLEQTKAQVEQNLLSVQEDASLKQQAAQGRELELQNSISAQCQAFESEKQTLVSQVQQLEVVRAELEETTKNLQNIVEKGKDLAAELIATKDELTQTQSVRDELLDKTKRVEVQCTTLLNDVIQRDRTIQDMNETLEKVRKEMISRIEHLTEDLAHEQEERLKVYTQTVNDGKIIDDLNKQVADLTAARITLEGEVQGYARLEVDLRSQIDTLVAEKNAAQNELCILDAKGIELTGALKVAEAHIANQAKQVQDLLNTVANLNKNYDAQGRQCDLFHGELERATADALQLQVYYENQLKSAQLENAAALDEIQSIKALVENLQTTLESEREELYGTIAERERELSQVGFGLERLFMDQVVAEQLAAKELALAEVKGRELQIERLIELEFVKAEHESSIVHLNEQLASRDMLLAEKEKEISQLYKHFFKGVDSRVKLEEDLQAFGIKSSEEVASIRERLQKETSELEKCKLDLAKLQSVQGFDSTLKDYLYHKLDEVETKLEDENFDLAEQLNKRTQVLNERSQEMFELRDTIAQEQAKSRQLNQDFVTLKEEKLANDAILQARVELLVRDLELYQSQLTALRDEFAREQLSRNTLEDQIQALTVAKEAEITRLRENTAQNLLTIQSLEEKVAHGVVLQARVEQLTKELEECQSLLAIVRNDFDTEKVSRISVEEQLQALTKAKEEVTVRLQDEIAQKTTVMQSLDEKMVYGVVLQSRIDQLIVEVEQHQSQLTDLRNLIEQEKRTRSSVENQLQAYSTAKEAQILHLQEQIAENLLALQSLEEKVAHGVVVQARAELLTKELKECQSLLASVRNDFDNEKVSRSSVEEQLRALIKSKEEVDVRLQDEITQKTVVIQSLDEKVAYGVALQARIDQLVIEVDQHQAQLADLRNQFEQEKLTRSDAENQLQALGTTKEAEIAHLQEDISQKLLAMQSLEEKVAHGVVVQARVEQLTKELEECQSLLASVRNDFDNEKVSRSSVEEQLRALIKSKEEVDVRLQDEITQKTAVIQSLDEKVAYGVALQARIEQLVIEVDQHQAQLADLRNQFEQEKLTRSDVENQLQALGTTKEAEIAHLQEDISQKLLAMQSLEEKVAHGVVVQARAEQLTKELEECQSLLASVRNDFDYEKVSRNKFEEELQAVTKAKEEETSHLQEEVSQKSSIIQSLEEKVAYGAVLQARVEHLTTELENCQSQLTAIRNDFEQENQLRSTLGEQMQALTTAKEGEIARLHEEATQKIETIRSLEEVISKLQRSLEEARADKTTLESQFQLTSTMTSAQIKELEAALAEKSAVAVERTAQIAMLESQMADRLASRDHLVSDLKHLTDSTNEEQVALKTQLTTREAEIAENQKELENMRLALQSQTAARNNIEIELAQIRRDYEDRLSSIQFEITAKEREISELQTDVSHQHESNQNEILSLQSVADDLRNQIEMLKTELAHFKSEYQSKVDALDELRVEVNRLHVFNAQESQLRTEAEDMIQVVKSGHKEELDKLVRQNEEARTLLDARVKELNEREERLISELEAVRREISEKSEKEAADSDERIHELERALQYVEETFHKQTEIELESLRSKYRQKFGSQAFALAESSQAGSLALLTTGFNAEVKSEQAQQADRSNSDETEERVAELERALIYAEQTFRQQRQIELDTLRQQYRDQFGSQNMLAVKQDDTEAAVAVQVDDSRLAELERAIRFIEDTFQRMREIDMDILRRQFHEQFVAEMEFQHKLEAEDPVSIDPVTSEIKELKAGQHTVTAETQTASTSSEANSGEPSTLKTTNDELSQKLSELEVALRQQKVSNAVASATIQQLTSENEDLILQVETSKKEQEILQTKFEELRKSAGGASSEGTLMHQLSSLFKGNSARQTAAPSVAERYCDQCQERGHTTEECDRPRDTITTKSVVDMFNAE